MRYDKHWRPIPDTFDERWPPNATRRRVRIWSEASKPTLNELPSGAVYVEKWSNGHYSDPMVARGGLLDTDNSGSPMRTCERRIVTDPAVQIRAHRAEAWEEGFDGAIESWERHDPQPNPYREADRGI